MSKLGFYTLDDTMSVKMGGYFKDSEAVPDWVRTDLVLDGVPVAKSRQEDGISNGVYVVGKKLMLNGDELVLSKENNPQLRVEKGIAKFGNLALGSPDKCINITKADYVKLRSGQTVQGYGRYNPKAVYRIVSDTASADIVEFTPEFDAEDLIYNNLVDDNNLVANERTDATFLSCAPPSISMRGFDPIISKGDSLDIRFFVDTKYYDSVHIKKRSGAIRPSVQLDQTFTVTIKGKDDTVLAQRTVYAGENQFTISFGDDFTGVTWFSIQCIDSRGRESVEQFYDVLVLDPEQQKPIYEMQEEDLARYGFTLNSGRNDFAAGYNNKHAFRRMFEAIEGTYGGVKLYNTGNDTYWIDNHPCIGFNDGVPQFGRVEAYYLVYFDKDQNKLFGVNQSGTFDVGETGSYDIASFEDCKIIPGRSFLVDNILRTYDGTVPVDEWILADGAHIYRELDGKIRVPWGVMDGNDTEVQKGSQIFDYLHVSNLNFFVVNGQRNSANAVLENYEKINKLSQNFTKTGYYYCNFMTPMGTNAGALYNREYFHFPDNFVFDMNGATLRVTESSEIQACPAVIQLVGSDNVHIINGKVVGMYDVDVDTEGLTDEEKEIAIRDAKDHFLKIAAIRQGRNMASSVAEGNPNIQLFGCRFCTVENIDNACSAGYENTCGYENGFGTVKGSGFMFECRYGKNFEFSSRDLSAASLHFDGQPVLGYMDYGGVMHTDTAEITVTNCTNPVDEDGNPYPSGTGTVKLAMLRTAKGADKVELIKVRTGIKALHADSTKDVLKDMSDGTVFIGTASLNNTRLQDRGAFHEIFVYCYAYANNVYTLLKVIKSQFWRAIKVPEGTTHVSVAGYCWYTGGQITKLGSINVYTPQACLGCSFINVTTHDTRSIGLNGMGINLRYIGCDFYNIQNTLAGLNMTSMLMDIEENNCTGCLLTFENCTCYTREYVKGRQNDQSVVQPSCRNVNFIGCDGIGFKGQALDSYVIGNRFSEFQLINLGRKYSNYQAIIRHNSVSNVLGGKNVVVCQVASHKKNGVVTNSSVEPVTKYTTLQDCFMYQPGTHRDHPTSVLLDMLPADSVIITGKKVDDVMVYTNTVHTMQETAQMQYNEINE